MAASLAHEIKQPIAAAITSANTCIEWLAHEPPNLDRARAAAGAGPTPDEIITMDDVLANVADATAQVRQLLQALLHG